MSDVYPDGADQEIGDDEDRRRRHRRVEQLLGERETDEGGTAAAEPSRRGERW